MRLIFLTTLILTQFAFADLGGNESKINDEEKEFKAISHTKKNMTGYSVHELTMDGTLVKEYVTPSGTIFAVSWRGMRAPNLKTLFGGVYAEYESERSKVKLEKGNRHVQVSTGNIVVHHGGQMRDMHGFAYVPSAVPPGVNIDQLQ